MQTGPELPDLPVDSRCLPIGRRLQCVDEIVGTRGTFFVGSLRKTALTIMTRAGSSQDIAAHWLTRFAEAYLQKFLKESVTDRES